MQNQQGQLTIAFQPDNHDDVDDDDDDHDDVNDVVAGNLLSNTGSVHSGTQ